MPLSRGARLGPYTIVSAIGAGGMGEVYRAKDTRLGRDVAIKVLPALFTADPDRLARFEREARILASLNHPNIAAIHGLEQADRSSAIVMELVDGATLEERMSRPMPLAEALAVASQIAAALEAAHGAGVIHRDLKPANIKLRPDGLAKVLDFGLAKAVAPSAGEASTLTQDGVVMGTPAYMSPEQARGEATDEQTDIWAFGVVLYALLSGAPPFERPTMADTIAAVLGTSPDYASLPPEVPAPVRRLLRRCLEKDRKRRLKHAGDVRIDIEDAIAALGGAAEPPGRAPSARRRGVAQATAAVALAALAALGGWWFARRSASTPGVVRLAIPTPDAPIRLPVGTHDVEISRDGSRVAYASSSRLWIRRMDGREESVLPAGCYNPFFSPDGEWLGFVSTLGIYKVSVHGGTPALIFATSERSGGATWGTDGTIVFATSGGLYQVSENGGTARLLAKPDAARRERGYAWPHFLPDGGAVLFTIVPQESVDGARIAVLDLKSGTTRVLLEGGTSPRYLPTGRLLYAAGQSLKTAAFDLGARQVRGTPVAVPDVEVSNSPDNGAAQFAVANAGTLVFVSPGQLRREARTLSWVDRHGQEELLGLAPGIYQYPRISPDGTRVAIDTLGANRDIWIWDLRRPSLTKLTDGPTEDLLPVWNADGTRVFFASDRGGNFDIYSQAADGATRARVEFSAPGTQMPIALTPDGTRLLVEENFKNIGVLNLARPAALDLPFRDGHNYWVAEVSPDGKWIAYESDESGTQTEVYLRPFPDVSGRREKISLDGGRYPHWGKPGSGELFYEDLKGNMMSAEVTLSPALRLGRVIKLFAWERPPRGVSGRLYDTSPIDGRFLMIKSASNAADPGPVNISVVLNWSRELDALPRGAPRPD